MADPEAASDNDGEWFEIYNPGSNPVNLKGWSVVDQGGDSYLFSTDLIVPVNGYVVLARNADVTINGGVPADDEYSGLTLANGEDELNV